jgi:hypothetical protein
MPTLVTALTLVSLVKLSHLGYKPWELSFFLALIVGAVLWGSLSWTHWLFNVLGMFGTCTAWLTGLQATDHIGGQSLHLVAVDRWFYRAGRRTSFLGFNFLRQRSVSVLRRFL